MLDLLRDYGLDDFYLELSTRPEGKAVGSEEEWDEATEELRLAASAMDVPLVMDPGGGAFYGPKISVQARDAIGRTWQMSTIQVDFQLPQRFDLHYAGADGKRHRPVMIHRALFGSVERFFGVLTEHYAGAFPLWLAPEQLRLVPVADRNVDAAHELAAARARRGAPRGGRRREAVGRQEDPRRPADEGAVRGRDRRPRPRGRHVHGPPTAAAMRRAGVAFDRIVEVLARGGHATRRLTPSTVLMERLWSPWRMEYIQANKDDPDDDRGCVFCALLAGELTDQPAPLRVEDLAFVSLAKYPYNPGHLVSCRRATPASSRT